MQSNQSWQNLLSFVKMKLGASVRKLEYIDEQIIEYLKEHTMANWSVNFPYQTFHDVKYHEDKVPNREDHYYLKVRDGLSIYSVVQIYNTNLTQLFNIDFTVMSDPMGAQMFDEQMAYYMVPTFVDLVPPNMMRISNSHIIQRDFTIKIEVNHVTPATIRAGLYHVFKEIVLGDVADLCLAQREIFSTVRSPLAEVQMNLDRLNKFVDRRNELMTQVEENYVLSAHQKVFVF